MRNLTLLIFVNIITIFNILAQPIEPGAKTLKQISTEQNFIKTNNVQFIDIYEYPDSVFNSDVARIITHKEFDKYGKQISEICFNCETDSMKTVFEYYPSNLIKTITSYFDLVYPEIKSFVYDSKGKLIDEKTASGESRLFRFQYNNSGLISKKTGKCYAPNNDGKYIWSDCQTTTYNYDKINRLYEILWWYVPGWGIPRKMILKYNSKNQLIKLSQFIIGNTDKDWKPEFVTEYLYNEKGLIIKEFIDNFSDGKRWLEYRYLNY